jgi:hypothetical protein
MNIPENILSSIEFLPDGSATFDAYHWFEAWAQYTANLIETNKIDPKNRNCYCESEIAGNSLINQVYLDNRILH